MTAGSQREWRKNDFPIGEIPRISSIVLDPASSFPGSFWPKSTATIPAFPVPQLSFDKFPGPDIRAPSIKDAFIGPARIAPDQVFLPGLVGHFFNFSPQVILFCF
jgi:hypothetical protein